MKKILVAVMLLLAIKVEAQPSLWLGSNVIDKNINGGVIVKNDTIELEVKINPNMSDVRSVYFDFQHQKDAITLLSITRGPAIPANASVTIDNYYYPNCQFNKNAQNTTSDGWVNWQFANYECNSSTVPYAAINRVMVNVSSTQNLEQATYVKLRFRVTNVDAGFPYDSVYMNFAVAYAATGADMRPTGNTTPTRAWVQLQPGANNLVTGQIKHSENVSGAVKSTLMLSVTNTETPPVQITSMVLGTAGTFGFAQQLQTNTPYRLRLNIPSEQLSPLSLSATTVSDYTMAFQEFLTQNLDGTFKNNNITRGIKYWAADVNNNGNLDGGDLQLLFNAVTGLDTIMKPAPQCGANCFMSLPIMTTSAFDGLTLTSWKNLTLGSTSFIPLTTTTADQQLSMNYVLKGDVNLSHSSPVTAQQAAAMRMGSLVVPGASSIDVNVNNIVVTTNTINIPFTIDTRGNKLTALQFEVKYDATKVKFEKMEVNTPSWISFVNPTGNVIRFGALDRELKNTLLGTNLVPFRLHFSALQAGVDLNTSVEIVPVMDAANDKGNQLGINFNTNVIKLIGANFFRNQ
jgi:hypothetical protein